MPIRPRHVADASKLARRPMLASLLAATAAAAFRSSASAQPAAAPDERSIADAYIYLLGRLLVIRQEHTDLAAPGAAYNRVRYNPLGSAEFVNPNFDVAYLEAWIAVDDATPVLLDVPEIRGRYYTAQLLDEWGEVIANINERNFPSKPFGSFALVKPGSTAAIPAGAGRIMLHSGKAKLLGRVELKDDREGAIRLQQQFKVTPLGTSAVVAPRAIPTFDNQDFLGVECFDAVDAVLASALDVSPVAAEMQQKARWVAAHAVSNPAARAAVDTVCRKVVPKFQDYALTRSAPRRNHWTGAGRIGNYGSNFRLRSSVNFAGIWANVVDEAVYFATTRDANERPLSGSSSYVIHFPPDRLPGSVVDAYWSVILVGVPDYRVVPNPLNRFNVNSYSPLGSDPDGSLKIAIGPRPVAGVPESNWLPSQDGKPFSLTFRTYVPKEIVKRGEWQSAPVTLVR